MAETTNLHLKKPEYSDVADVNDLNDNMDIIDAAIGQAQTDIQNRINKPSGVEEGKFLQTDNGGDAVWGDPFTQEQINSAVGNWMDDHAAGGTALTIDDTLTQTAAAAQSKAAGDAIKSALAQTAPVFNAATAYSAGQYVTYNGALYRLTADHAANDAWADTSKTAVTTGGELSDLKSALNEENAVDLLYMYANHESWTLRGVTFTWSSDKRVCAVSGEASGGYGASRFYANTTALPSWLKAGEKYLLKYRTTTSAAYPNECYMYIAFYGSGESLISERYYKADSEITVPSNAVGAIVRLQVNSGKKATGNVYVQLLNTETNTDLTKETTIVNKNGKMRSFGNSILTGSVWISGSGAGLAAYDNAPYGQIAKSLGIKRENVTHTLISSTGFIYDAGSGSFLENIKETSLVGYDYLLTHFFFSDLESTYALGTIYDKKTDQTLAGAVVDLCDYINTSNSQCQLILVSAPPVSYTHYGATVFTDNYANGFSIADLDALMHELAKKYHFIYIDWQQLELSYHYQDYTDGDNVHANNEITYRAMGEYLGKSIVHDKHEKVTDSDLDKLKVNNGFDLLEGVASYNNVSLNNVAFTWNSDHTECAVANISTGASTGRTATNLIYTEYNLPDNIKPGDSLRVDYNTTDENLVLEVTFFRNNTLTGTVFSFTESGGLPVPTDATGMRMRLLVESGVEIDAKASSIKLYHIPAYDLESVDYVKTLCYLRSGTSNGVEFTWSKDGTCHVEGTASPDVAVNTLYKSGLPDGMQEGDRMILQFKVDSQETHIAARVYFYDANGTTLLDKYTEFHPIGNYSADVPFVVPVGAKAMTLRVYIPYRAADPFSVNCNITKIKLVKVEKRKMSVPLMFSIIDDDTTNDTFVTRFHDACCHNGVKGNYAVITDRIDDGDTSQAKMLQYEDEGFGCLIHASDQDPTGTPYWNDVPRSDSVLTECRANLAKGIRRMKEMGFLNYKYWITPGGHYEDDMIEMAKELSLEFLASTNNGRHNTMQDYDRFCIKRISLRHDDNGVYDNSMAGVKALIDKTVADGSGWIIITTHFNEGWSDLTWDTTLDENGYPVGYARFNEMAQYAISKGLVPMSIPRAWSYYRPVLDANKEQCDRANA